MKTNKKTNSVAFLLSLGSFINFQLNAQIIPNASFENWSVNSSFVDSPDDWTIHEYGYSNYPIIESNSALKYLKPDLAIFVRRENSILKPSAKEIYNKVDLVITL